MKNVYSYKEFLNEKKKSFEDEIKGDGYFKGISVSTARKKAKQMAKQAKMDDDDPDAYKPMPGSTKGKKLLKKSKHTKNYEELYGESESFVLDDPALYENFSTITATGLSKENVKDLEKMVADIKQMGPGWYLIVKDSDKKKVIDYLKDQNIPLNEKDETVN